MKELVKMNWFDALLLPIVMISWLFLSYESVSRFCTKRRWAMKDGVGMKIWVVTGFAGGAYIMHIFNAI